ncbi:tRNA-binding protein [Cryomorpha ignava]|uniref:tRNA-binding protein n=1 Tax=Cryomorpha ignava TaxID=101383 RepID=A0A7K3WTG5_9FLAO|nr:tRNA-binding protein [Cryomorpha ignava]NEN24321.1 tRNA-binding protein [Cryomorpha ignava]
MSRKPFIEWSDFEKIDIRTGTIITVENFDKARKPAYKLWIDFGELGELKTSAQITDIYSLNSLKGKQVLAIVNFKPKQIADFMSECLVLGVYTNNGVVLLETERGIGNGERVG